MHFASFMQVIQTLEKAQNENQLNFVQITFLYTTSISTYFMSCQPLYKWKAQPG